MLFALTVCAVHYAHSSAHFYGLVGDAKWGKTVSVLTLFAGLWAAISLFLLTIFDTYRAHERHQFLLLSVGGLGGFMVTIPMVWFDQTWNPTRWKGLV